MVLPSQASMLRGLPVSDPTSLRHINGVRVNDRQITLSVTGSDCEHVYYCSHTVVHEHVAGVSEVDLLTCRNGR